MLCWLHRIAVGQALDAGHPPSARLERHLSGCPSCRAFHHSQARLVAGLGAGARAQVAAPPAFLHGKIMARIRRTEAEPQPATHFPIWAMAIAGLILVAGLLPMAPRLVNPAGKFATVQPEQPARPPAVAKLALPDSTSVLAWGTNWAKPLETEFQALASDARSALSLVANNFLPGALPTGGE